MKAFASVKRCHPPCGRYSVGSVRGKRFVQISICRLSASTPSGDRPIYTIMTSSSAPTDQDGTLTALFLTQCSRAARKKRERSFTELLVCWAAQQTKRGIGGLT